MSRKASVVKAVHESDLKNILVKLGLYNDLVQGRLRCAICGRPLSPETPGGLYKESGLVKLVCNNIECLVEAAERVAARRHVR